MIIPKNILTSWEELRERGDIKELSAYTGASHVTIGRVLNTGKCSETLFKKIRAFYNERKKLLKA